MNEIYKAIYDRLKAYLGTNFPKATIGQHIPQGTEYPYIQINGMDARNNETNTEEGYRATIDVISWSQYRGSKQVTEMMEHVKTALHQYHQTLDASLTIYGMAGMYESFNKVVTESDGLTRQGMQRFTLLFDKR